ncbi:type II toxin-antitoxin system RelE/ParE family toxin [Methylobacterium sp. Gmos1]
MTREIVFHRLARADLFDIYDYIERQSGSARASTYLGRIETACNGLKDFPEKGTPRNDIAVGVRTWRSSAGS